MRQCTWGCIKEKMKTRSGYHAYHMRHWLRLLRRSRSLSSYPLPLSMLTPGGINRNSSNVHVANINSSLKNIKSEVTVDFIRPNNKGIIVITNKIAATSDLKVTEDYMKNLNNVDLNDVMSPRLPQSKSYLKILGILYLICYSLKLELRLLLGKDLRRR